MKVPTSQWVILGIVVVFGLLGSLGRPGALLVSFVLAALLIVVSFLDWGNDNV